MTATRSGAVLAGLALLLAACGDDTASTGATEPDAPAPIETTATTVPDVSTAEPPTATAPPGTAAPESTTAQSSAADPVDGAIPQRIVSLSPTLTEMMFAIGADDLLVAVDSFSDHPAGALDLPHELAAYEPNVEAIAGYEPDLVLISGDFTGLGDQLASLGIDLWDGPAATTLADTYDEIEQLGALTGHIAEAAAVVADMQSEIDAILTSLPESEVPLTYYHELDSSLYSVTSDTFIGQLYSLAGLANVADAVGADAGGYPQLNAEYLVEANPDLIFLADTKCCAESAATVAERAGWDAIAAVQTGHIFEMDDDVASRWGPRVVDYLQAIADAVTSVRQPQT